MTGVNSLTDLELIERVKSGDKMSFSVLVRRHQQGLLRLCLRFMKDRDLAADVAQESFIKAFERLASFEARASFKSWLFTIAINSAKNRLRDKKKDVNDIEDIQLGVAPTAEFNLVKQSIAADIAKLIDQLPFKQKTALNLRIYEDLSFKEISEIMGCPYDTAKANYRHALLKLKEQIEDRADLRSLQNEVSGVFTEWNQKALEVEA